MLLQQLLRQKPLQTEANRPRSQIPPGDIAAGSKKLALIDIWISHFIEHQDFIFVRLSDYSVHLYLAGANSS